MAAVTICSDFASCVQLCATPWTDCSLPGSFVHGESPDKNTGLGCHALLRGIFPTQGSNPGLLHFRQVLYHLSHEGSPRILEWVAYPFSKGSSQSRNQTRVSCLAGRFFTSWTTRESSGPYTPRSLHGCFCVYSPMNFSWAPWPTLQ